MQEPVSPVKAKKKKSSFLDDDDFFVMKKSKKPKTKNAAASVTVETSQATIEKSPEASIVSRMEATAIKASRTPSLDDRNPPYFSASETFSNPSPIDMASHVSAPNTQVGTEMKQEEPKVKGEININSKTETIDLSDDDDDVNKHVNEHVLGKGPDISPEEEEEDSDLRSFFQNVTQSFEDTRYESSRLYDVKIISKLGIPLEYDRQIKGNTTFEGLLRVLQSDTLREHGIKDYWSHGVLVWIEGKSELKPIFKPSTLRIPPKRGEVSKITCLYIPREHLGSFDKLYEEFAKTSDNENGEVDTENDSPTIYSLSDSEEEKTKEAPKSEYFVIGLKGKDNKRVEAEVGPTTKIRSLLKYYLQVKGIKGAKVERCKLLFDDEELDLDSVVGDTELEEDFELQVYIK